MNSEMTILSILILILISIIIVLVVSNVSKKAKISLLTIEQERFDTEITNLKQRAITLEEQSSNLAAKCKMFSTMLEKAKKECEEKQQRKKIEVYDKHQKVATFNSINEAHKRLDISRKSIAMSAKYFKETGNPMFIKGRYYFKFA